MREVGDEEVTRAYDEANKKGKKEKRKRRKEEEEGEKEKNIGIIARR